MKNIVGQDLILTWSAKCTVAVFLFGVQYTFFTFPKREKCLRIVSMLLTVAGTFLATSTVNCDRSSTDDRLRLKLRPSPGGDTLTGAAAKGKRRHHILYKPKSRLNLRYIL